LLLLSFLLLTAPFLGSLNVTKPSSFTEWAMVFLTVLYVFVTFAQGLILKRTLDANREANRLTLRAWLAITDVKDFKILPNKLHEFAVELKNVGHVPAIMRGVVSTRYFLRPEDPWPTEDEIDEPRDPLILVLPSGVLHTQGFDVAPLSPEDVDRINTHEVRLIVTATLSYTDVLNSDGLTHLVSVYLPGSETWVIAPEGNVMR